MCMPDYDMPINCDCYDIPYCIECGGLLKIGDKYEEFCSDICKDIAKERKW